MGTMSRKPIRGLGALALLATALQPCLACGIPSERPAVAASGCHESAPPASSCEAMAPPPMVTIATPVRDGVGLDRGLGPALVAVSIVAPAPSGAGSVTTAPAAPPSSSLLWLRHTSLRI